MVSPMFCSVHTFARVFMIFLDKPLSHFLTSYLHFHFGVCRRVAADGYDPSTSLRVLWRATSRNSEYILQRS